MDLEQTVEEQRLGFPALDKKYHLLIAEDGEAHRLLLRQYLGPRYRLTMASNGLEALELLKQNPEADLVILDVMMPGLSGYEVCQRIRSEFTRTDLPVILLTAKDQTADLIAGFQAGANDYLNKPFRKQELRARVESHLQLKEEALEQMRNIARLRLEIASREKSAMNLMVTRGHVTRILDIAAEALLVFNSQRRITFINQRAEQLFGYRLEEILDKPIEQVFPDLETLDLGLKFPQQRKLRAVHGNATDLQLEFSLIPLQLEGEQGFVISVPPGKSVAAGEGDSLPLNLSMLGFPEGAMSPRLQQLEHTVTELVQSLARSNAPLMKEMLVLPPAAETPSAEEQDLYWQTTLRELLVLVMSQSLRYWEQTTQKTKIYLAEESRIWTISLNQGGSYQTRTLDRYLHLATLPQKPRWRDVLRTSYYVLQNCPDSPRLKKDLETSVDRLAALIHQHDLH